MAFGNDIEHYQYMQNLLVLNTFIGPIDGVLYTATVS